MNWTSSNLLWIYEQYNKERQEKEKYIQKLEDMEDRYITLTKNFTLHMDICRSHSKDWQGRKV